MPFRDAWLVLGVFLVILGFGAAQPAIGLMGVVIVILGAVARYWSKHLFDRVELKRRTSETRAFLGEEIQIDVELSNRKPLPLPWYEWRLALGEPLPVDGETLSALKTQQQPDGCCWSASMRCPTSRSCSTTR